MINNFIRVQLAPKQYNCCKDCPLCGLIPKSERIGDDKYVCLGTTKTISNAEFDGKSETRKCDSRWEEWKQLPKRIFEIPLFAYQKYRVPFETAKK